MRIYFLSFHLMTDYELKNINPDDNGDLLGKVERLFDIKFGDTELFRLLKKKRSHNYGKIIKGV